MAEDFWSDNRKAQAQMQQLNALREEITTWEEIETQLKDLLGLAELLEEVRWHIHLPRVRPYD